MYSCKWFRSDWTCFLKEKTIQLKSESDYTHNLELSNVMEKVESLKSHSDKLQIDLQNQTVKLEEQKVVTKVCVCKLMSQIPGGDHPTRHRNQ